MAQAIRAVVGGGIYIDRYSLETVRSSSRGSVPEMIEVLSQREQ
jgi:DNA-binding NarL/FixJ family response regulator